MVKSKLERLIRLQRAHIRGLERENERLKGKLELMQEMRDLPMAQAGGGGGNAMQMMAAGLAAAEDDEPPVEGAIPAHAFEEHLNMIMSSSGMDFRPPGEEDGRE